MIYKHCPMNSILLLLLTLHVKYYYSEYSLEVMNFITFRDTSQQLTVDYS